MKRFSVCMLVCLVAVGGLLWEAQGQEKYPTRPIELVVPFNPGGGADLAARTYSDALAKILGVPVNVVNRAGGTGIIGTGYVIRGKKDGYTLLATTDTPLIVGPVISKEVTYDPVKDLVPIGHLGSAPSVFAVRADSPFKTLHELVAYARSNPGKLKNASAGFGTEASFNLQILCQKEKINIVMIPFKSGGEAVPALLGGHTDMSSNTSSTLGPHLKAGTVRGLAIASRQRHPDFPDIPTTVELGYPEVDLTVWYALFAPTGVPQNVIDVLVPAVEKAFNDPAVVERAVNTGFTVEYIGPQGLGKLLESGLQKIREVAPDADLAAKP